MAGNRAKLRNLTEKDLWDMAKKYYGSPLIAVDEFLSWCERPRKTKKKG